MKRTRPSSALQTVLVMSPGRYTIAILPAAGAYEVHLVESPDPAIVGRETSRLVTFSVASFPDGDRDAACEARPYPHGARFSG